MMGLNRIRVAIVTVVPSPYQIDLFRELAALPEIDLHVFYLEEETPGLPWPPTPRQPYETILRGFWFGPSTRRFHLNWPMPDLRAFDVVISSTYMSITGQWLMRRQLKNRPWLFWGERMREQPTAFKRAIQRVLTRPLMQARAIVGMGSVSQRSYEKNFPGVPTFNVPYYSDLEAFTAATASRTRVPNGEIAYLCCGQMIHRKGIDLLLRAFERLVDEGAPVRLLLVGPEAQLPEMLREVKTSTVERVEFRGFAAPGDLPAHFADADVFVLPSRHDGWGVVVNQALGAGLPLICSDAVGAAHDLIESNINGVMFANEDEEALYQAMKRLADDHNLVKEWSNASLQKSTSWSPREGALAWLRILQEVTGRKSAPISNPATLEMA